MPSKGDEGVETLNELRIWIAGKFDLVQQAQTICREDITAVRTRVHDLSNEITKLIALDVPGKIEQLKIDIKDHDREIEKLNTDAATRQGSVNAVKAGYAVGGTVIGIIVAVALEIAKVIHP